VQAKFNVEETKSIVLDIVENNLGGVVYHAPKVNSLSNSLVEKILTQLTRLNKPFKYVGTSLKPRNVVQTTVAVAKSAFVLYTSDHSWTL
jgi:hypothetical protein